MDEARGKSSQLFSCNLRATGYGYGYAKKEGKGRGWDGKEGLALNGGVW